jgi:hypothetical protein
LVQEDRAARSLASALRAVANAAGKRDLVVARRAKALCGQLGDGYAELALREACHDAGQPELASELLECSYRAAGRDSAACQKLPRCAAQLLPYLADPRGRPLSVETAMHELLLNVMRDRGTPRAFSWSFVSGSFVDAVTEATQIAVGDPAFDPRPAVRRQRRLARRRSGAGARR